MTALNVILGRDEAHVITDGAVIGPDGRVVYPTQKVVTFAHMKAAVALSGPEGILCGFVTLFPQVARTYDDLRDKIGDRLKTIIDGIAEELPSNEQFEVVVAGWSMRRRGPAAFKVRSFDFEGLAAWTAFDVELALFGPADDAFMEEFGPVVQDGRYRIEQLAGDIIDRQRFIRGDVIAFPGSGPMNMAGCFAQLTTVTARDVSTRIVRVWHDEMETGALLGQRPPPIRQVTWGAGAFA